MKARIFFIFTLVFVNVLLFSLSCSSPKTSETAAVEEKTAPIDTIQGTLPCLAGGIGATECSVGPGYKIGNEITTGCEISCYGDTYACCGIRCTCIPNPK